MQIKSNIHQFDCRRYIIPGDIIQYMTLKSCDSANLVASHTEVKVEGEVIAVYEKFVLVKLKKIVDCANRWNIRKVNGMSIGSTCGCFSSMYGRA